MSKGQFNKYAQFYDLLYKDKNYKDEAEFVHSLIKNFSIKEVNEISLLDLACGTGKHLFELEKIGYIRPQGSDISLEMISVANDIKKRKESNAIFHNYSFQDSSNIDQKFDVVISMFSAVNYIVNLDDQLKSFNNINTLLNPNGLFIFDYWNGNAVTRDYSPLKFLKKNEGETEIQRISETVLDQINQSATVKFSCSLFSDNKRIEEFIEVHQLHYYYFSEIKALLKFSGFDIIHICPFMKMNDSIEPFDWNITIVASKLN